MAWRITLAIACLTLTVTRGQESVCALPTVKDLDPDSVYRTLIEGTGGKCPELAIVALVPDPARTRLSLYFDRSVNSLMKAASADGYQFDRHWLPTRWRPERERPGKCDELKYEPGLMLFRKRSKENAATSYLAIWLVGETPTEGLDRKAFDFVVDHFKGGRMRILGPTFSGTSHSLQRAIGSGNPILVSGSATAKDELATLGYGKSALQTTLHDDTQAMAALVKELERIAGRTSRTAVLVEGDTAFGAAARPVTNNTKIWLSFPRHLAHLRNATEEALIKQQAKPASAGTESGRVPFSLRDKAATWDSVPPLAELQTPLAQEAVLMELSRTLRHEGVNFVVIFASDVLDAIFLSRYVARTVPEVRVIIPDADQLFVRANEHGDLTGLLSLTTYPLLGSSSLIFGSRFEAGYYVAALALLGNLKRERHPPVATGPPSLWLTALGRDGYVPVRRLDHVWDKELHPGIPENGDFRSRSPMPWRIAGTLLSLALAGWIAIKVRKHVDRYGKSPSPWMATITLAGMICWSPFAVCEAAAIRAEFGYAALALLTGIAATVLYFWGPSIALLLLAAELVFLGLGCSGPDRPLFVSRTSDLTSGVSAVMPLLVLGLSMLWWAFTGWRRSQLKGVRSPNLPKAGRWTENLKMAKGKFDLAMGDPSVLWLHWPLGRYITIASLVVAAWVSGPGPTPQSIEGKLYDFTFCIFFATMATLLFSEWARFMRGWIRLRLFLAILGQHPIRFVFARVRSPHSGTLIWQGGDRRTSFTSQARFIERVGRLVPLMRRRLTQPNEHGRKFLFEDKVHYEGLYRAQRDRLDELVRSAALGEPETPKTVRELQDGLAELSDGFIGRLDRYWCDGGTPDWEKTPNSPEAIAEEAVALRYLAFMRYGFLQLRNILMFLSGGFLLMLLAVNSYPFQGRRQMIWLLTVFFLLAGGGIVTMLAQSDRDPIISRLSESKEGAVGKRFVFQLISYGGLPLLGLVNSYFPWFGSVSQTFLQPALDLLKK